MKDVVIPLANFTNNGHIELKYCLRSIEMWVPDARKVFIVGGKPAFIRNVEWISAGDRPGIMHKERNIFQKIFAAVNDKRVSDDFFFFNDDHFLLQRFAPSFDHKGLLSDSLKNISPSNPYIKTLQNTLGVLGGGFDYDTHCPTIFNKDLFMKTVGEMEWFRPFGFGIKSIYGNLVGVGGEYYPDLKIRNNHHFRDSSVFEGRKYFSTADTAMTAAMIHKLKKLYPNKSKYEK